MTKLRGHEMEKPLEQKRVILVLDAGWVFAGDQSLTSDGYIRLSRAVHVFAWTNIGFAGIVANWKSTDPSSGEPVVDLRPMADIEAPPSTVLFRITVPDDWGLP